MTPYEVMKRFGSIRHVYMMKFPQEQPESGVDAITTHHPKDGEVGTLTIYPGFFKLPEHMQALVIKHELGHIQAKLYG